MKLPERHFDETQPASRTRFYLDKSDAKWKGVCAGIADYTGMDVTIVRVGVLVLTLASGGWPGLLAYLFMAWFTPNKPAGLYESRDAQKFWQGVRVNPSRTAHDVRSRLRDIDRRLADIETYHTSGNRQLECEIDSLR